MKTIRRNSVFLAVVVSAALAGRTFGGDYDDYIQYKGSGSVSAWDNGAYWDDDGNPPGPGKNYYIGKADYYYGWNGETGKTFQGDKLVVAKTFYFGGTSGTKIGFGDTEWVEGSMIFYYTPLQITGGKWTISTPASNPLRIEYSRTDGWERDYPQDFASPATGYAIMTRRHDQPNDTRGLTVYLKGDWSAYYGTFEISFAHSFYRLTGAGAFVCPGTIKLSEKGKFTFNAPSSGAHHRLGALDVGPEAKITLPTSSTIDIADSLKLAPGATIEHELKTMSSYDYAPSPKLLFVLSKKAYEAGLPDFSKVKLVSRASGLTSNGPFPTVYVKVVETADGGAKLYAAQKTIVRHVAQDLGQSTSVGIAEKWSDGQVPDPTNDYYCALTPAGTGGQLHFLNDSVWTGGTLFMDNEYAPIMMSQHSVTIPDLWLSSKAYIRPMGAYQQVYSLYGKLSVPAGGTGRFQLGDGNTLCVYSDLGGAGLLNIKYGGEQNDHAASYFGNLELRGDNRNFSGKFFLSMAGHTKWPAVVPSATVNVTAKVYDGFGFGGELAEFTYDALTVSNHCRVAVMEDADFTPVNRGWYLTDGEAYIQVAAGKKAELRSVLTLENAMTMVKEGAGALWIDQRVAIADDGSEGTITVAEGTLGVGASDVLAMLNVNVAAGAKIGVPLNGNGFDLVNGVTYFTYAGETLALSIDMSGATEAKYAVKLLTYVVGGEWDAAFDAETGHPPVVTLERAPLGYRIAGLRRVEEDGTVTLVADIVRVPFAFIVK